MIYYICDSCDEPAFYLKRKPKLGEPVRTQIVEAVPNGIWKHGFKSSFVCHCGYHGIWYDMERIMDNLEYVEYLAKKRNLL